MPLGLDYKVLGRLIADVVCLFCRIVSVRETRLTGIMSHVLIGLSLLFIDQLQLIPRPVLDGLFLYLAVTALHCNQLFERIMLLVTEQVRPSVTYSHNGLTVSK